MQVLYISLRKADANRVQLLWKFRVKRDLHPVKQPARFHAKKGYPLTWYFHYFFPPVLELNQFLVHLCHSFSSAGSSRSGRPLKRIWVYVWFGNWDAHKPSKLQRGTLPVLWFLIAGLGRHRLSHCNATKLTVAAAVSEPRCRMSYCCLREILERRFGFYTQSLLPYHTRLVAHCSLWLLGRQAQSFSIKTAGQRRQSTAPNFHAGYHCTRQDSTRCQS